MKNILLITIIIGMILYIVPSYALSNTLSKVTSKVDVYKSYNSTVQKMGLYPKDGAFLDHFTIEADENYIRYKLGKYNLQNNVLEVVVHKSTNEISEINIISKNTLGFWKNEDFISKMIISIAMMNPSLSLSKIYEIRNNLRMAYFKNQNNDKVSMNDDILQYAAYQDKAKHIVSISFNNKQNEELLMLDKKSSL